MLDLGVNPGVSMTDYHAFDAVSNSRLSRLARSPAHLRTYLREPHKDTPALAFGRAAHYAILEPEKFEKHYKQGPAGDRRTKANRDRWAELEAEVGAGNVLRPDEYEACWAMHDAVFAKRTASGMVTGSGEIELSCVWKDPVSGLLCKGRMDRHSPDLPGGAIVDLKTTRDASPREFERSIFTYRYFTQGAHYLNGARLAGLPAKHFVIIAIEKEPPYACGVYRLTEPAIEAGLAELRPLMDLYARLQETPIDDWGDYPDEVRDVSVPDWSWKVINNRVLEMQEEAR